MSSKMSIMLHTMNSTGIVNSVCRVVERESWTAPPWPAGSGYREDTELAVTGSGPRLGGAYLFILPRY